jgi:photosystem II stability/assembly factor-like uncharacterized protein
MTRLIFFFITIILFPFFLTAQTLDLDNFEKLSMRNIGPAGMSGRVTAIDVDLSDEDRIFVGTASGGVWKSENGGITWDPIFDDAATQSVGSLKINQQNPDEIWVGTGEGNPRNSHNSGKGIYRTIDGGKNWSLMGLEKTTIIHRIVIDQNNPSTVYAGALGSAWGDSEHRGVYKTTDNGMTWDKILYVDKRTGVADMIVDPTNPNKLFVAMWDFRRTPWDFTSGGKGSGFYRTVDGGTKWDKISDEDGLPEGDLGRIGVAISASKPNILYALVEAKENGLYKSTDGGYKWSLVSTKGIGNRPFYYAELYVDTQNENRLFNLYTYLSRSEDGGKSFKEIANYQNNVHPDHHAFWQSPTNPLYLIDGNDGGMNISRDGGDTWRFINNLPVGQFYHVNIDRDFPYHVYGGMQDNGSWIGPGFVLKSGGISNYDWQELYFGDGFDVSALPSDSRYGYAMSQGGNIGYYDRLTGMTKFVKPVSPDTTTLRFNWNAAFAQDPFNDCGIYFGSQFVHYSNDCGKSWTSISPDLTTNDPEKQKQDKSGGLTIDATFAENHTTILCIEPSVHNKDDIWVGTDDGNLQHSIDGGKNWSNVYSKLPAAPRNGWIPQIKHSKINEGEIFVVVNNYRMNDFAPYLYHSKDNGKTFRRIVAGKDVGSFVCSVIQDHKNENLIFLGTDAGLYYSLDRGASWSKYDKDFPSVQIRDMAIQEDFDDLVLGTFGRSFWVMDDLEIFRKIADDKSIVKKDLAILAANTGYNLERRSYDGIRFSGQADFRGENKSMYGAEINIWKKPKDKKDKNSTDAEIKKKSKNKKDKDKNKKEGDKMGKESEKDKEKSKKKATLYVLNMEGDTLRTLSPKLKGGLNKVRWFLDRKGVQRPSRRERKEDDGEPGGTPVMPGTYKVVVVDGNNRDSAMVDVKLDPRIDLNVNDLAKMEASIDDYNSRVEATANAFDQLKEAKKSIKLVNDMMVNQEDTVKIEIKDLGKIQSEQIDSLMNLFMDPVGLKGIQRNPKTLNALTWRTRTYIYDSYGAPTENAKLIINKYNTLSDQLINGVNDYISGDWKKYQEKVEAIPKQIFKKLEPVRIE